jgi:hypothetical protein
MRFYQTKVKLKKKDSINDHDIYESTIRDENNLDLNLYYSTDFKYCFVHSKNDVEINKDKWEKELTKDEFLEKLAENGIYIDL